jgi:hypothetical protein
VLKAVRHQKSLPLRDMPFLLRLLLGVDFFLASERT